MVHLFSVECFEVLLTVSRGVVARLTGPDRATGCGLKRPSAAGRRPRVRVTAGHEGEDWIFSVSDNGLGIDPAHHESVFERTSETEVSPWAKCRSRANTALSGSMPW